MFTVNSFTLIGCEEDASFEEIQEKEIAEEETILLEGAVQTRMVNGFLNTCLREISETINEEYITDLEDCYSEALNKKPSLRGWMSFKLAIQEGEVSLLRINSNLTGDYELSGCLKKQIEQWGFSAECTNIVVVPISFQGAKDEK